MEHYISGPFVFYKYGNKKSIGVCATFVDNNLQAENRGFINRFDAKEQTF